MLDPEPCGAHSPLCLLRLLQVLADAQGTIAGEAGKVRGSVLEAREQTVDRLGRYREQYAPQARKFDKM
jgi:hypothetical protein